MPHRLIGRQINVSVDTYSMSTPPQVPGGSSPRIQDVATRVRNMLSHGTVDPRSAISIIRATTEVAQSIVGPTKTNLVDIIEGVIVKIAKGRDGVLGTTDDVISADVLDILRMMLEHQLVRDVAAWVTDVAAVSCVPKLSWMRQLMFWK